MLKILSQTEDGCVSITFADTNVNLSLYAPYVVINDTQLPTEPFESWYIDNGVLKVNQAIAVQIQREQMPKLNQRQFRKLLRDNDLFDRAKDYVYSSGNGYIEDAWEFSEYFTRLDPFIGQAIIALGLNDEFVDSIWVSE